MVHVIGVERCRCSSESPDLRATPVRDGSIAINCSCEARTNRRADGPHTRRFGCIMLYRCFVLGLILKTSATSFFALKWVFNWALLRPINKNPFMERIEVLNHVLRQISSLFPSGTFISVHSDSQKDAKLRVIPPITWGSLRKPGQDGANLMLELSICDFFSCEIYDIMIYYALNWLYFILVILR